MYKKRFILFLFLYFLVYMLLCIFPVKSEDWPFELLRGNLHIHTSYSSPVKDLGTAGLFRTKPEIGHYDHFSSSDPEETCNIAKNINLNVLGLSDHDCAISYREWQNLGMIVQRYCKGNFIVIRGFEWTKEGMVNSEQKSVEHFNVFNTTNFVSCYPHFLDYGMVGLDKNFLKISDIDNLYNWFVSQSKNNSDIVCQFNHPTYGNSHFKNFAFPKDKLELKNIVTLLETGSGPPPFYENMEKSEMYYQQAIQCGWRIGPTNGIDNFGKIDKNSARVRHTGIWVTKSPFGIDSNLVIKALKARHIFASEDENFILKFWATSLGNPKTFFLGDVMPKDTTNKLFLSVELRDFDETVGQVKLVTVSKNGASEVDFSENCLAEKSGFFTSTYITVPKSDTIAYYIKIIQNDKDCIFSAPIFLESSSDFSKNYLKVNFTIPKNGEQKVCAYHPTILISFGSELKKTNLDSSAIVKIYPTPPNISNANKILIDYDYGEIQLVNYVLTPDTNYLIAVDHLESVNGDTLEKPFILSFKTEKKEKDSFFDVISKINSFSKFSASIITCKRTKIINGKIKLIGENSEYSIGENIIIFLKVTNLREKYSLPCEFKYKIFSPIGEYKIFTEKIVKEKSLEEKILNYKLVSKGKYKVLFLINGKIEANTDFMVR